MRIQARTSNTWSEPGTRRPGCIGNERVQRRLLGRVPLGCREVLAQFLRRTSWTVARSVALNAPPFSQRTGIHRIETELVDQASDGCLRRRIIASDDQSASILRARGVPVCREVGGVNVIERLDDLRRGQMPLQE